MRGAVAGGGSALGARTPGVAQEPLQHGFMSPLPARLGHFGDLHATRNSGNNDGRPIRRDGCSRVGMYGGSWFSRVRGSTASTCFHIFHLLPHLPLTQLPPPFPSCPVPPFGEGAELEAVEGWWLGDKAGKSALT